MLPTVLEETEEDLITPDQVETSSQPNSLKSGQSFSSSSNGIGIYPLDITDLVKGYNRNHPLSYSKPRLSLLPRELGVEIFTLHQLLKMGEVLKSTDYETPSSHGQQIEGSSILSPSRNDMGSPIAKCLEDSAGSNGGLSSEKVVDINTDVRDEEPSNNRNRKDSE
ncbi:hypothetical protein GUF49_20560, partial [Xanthomonas citri pv. citri]|nr:hypothetical protein [Xanthomonas citri pv. citri]